MDCINSIFIVILAASVDPFAAALPHTGGAILTYLRSLADYGPVLFDVDGFGPNALLRSLQGFHNRGKGASNWLISIDGKPVSNAIGSIQPHPGAVVAFNFRRDN